MAEADQEIETSKDKDNPFSFKKFMKRSSTDQNARGGELKTSKPSKTKTSKKARDEEEALPFHEVSEESQTDERDNPFSFRKFVNTKKKDPKPLSTGFPLFDSLSEDNSDDSNSETHDSFPSLSSSKETNTKTSSQLPTKSSRSYSLPAQTNTSSQEHSTRDKSDKKTSQPFIKTDLFDSDSDNSFGTTDEDSLLFQKSSLADLGPPLTSFTAVDNKDTRLIDKEVNPLISSPDEEDDLFKSDNPLSLKGSDRHLNVVASVSGLPNISNTAEGSALIRKLRMENEMLKLDLQNSQQESTKQKEKNSTLKEKLKSFKKKEAEDTKALEDMVQKVESNLVATTKRAVSAESTILKLKQEIQVLQVQLSQETPQSIQHNYEEMLRGVREKACYASSQLVMASQKADQSLRELVSGVETLKSVADILQFIDSVSEIREPPTG